MTAANLSAADGGPTTSLSDAAATSSSPAPSSAPSFSDLLQQAYSARQAGKVTVPTTARVGTAAVSVAGVCLPQPVASTSLAVPAAALSVLPPVGRQAYTPLAMVSLMLARPDYSHAQLCAHFARPASWLASVLASEAFQKALDPVRDQIADPTLAASLKERYQALAIRTSNVMMDKLDSPDATDFMVLKSGEIAMKALGLGQKHTEAPPPPAAPVVQQESLAERLMKMMDERERQRTVTVAPSGAVEDADEVSPNGNI